MQIMIKVQYKMFLVERILSSAGLRHKQGLPSDSFLSGLSIGIWVGVRGSLSNSWACVLVELLCCLFSSC